VSHPDLSRVTSALPDNLVQVPLARQREDYSCGAAAALSLLRYWRPEAYASVDEGALYAELRTTEAQGTEPEPMAALLRRNGLDAEYRHGDVTVAELQRAVDARAPPIVDLQAWRDDPGVPWRDVWNAGHYVLMVAYDDERLFFVDPSTMAPTGYVFLPRGELDERWHDLAGERNVPVGRMAIFAYGAGPWRPSEPPPRAATRLA
jgi:predicted double-glycine peptidase